MDQDETWRAGRPRPWPHCVRWGPRSPSPKGHSPPPQFSAHICCCQMAPWIKMPLGRKIGLDPSDIVLDGDAAPLPKKGPEPPIFGPCPLWPNGWMNQDATWYGGTLRPRPHCVRWGSSSPSPKRGRTPNFGPCVLWPNGWMNQGATWYEGRSRPRPHCVTWGPSSPSQKGHSPQFAARVYCGQMVAHLSYCWALVHYNSMRNYSKEAHIVTFLCSRSLGHSCSSVDISPFFTCPFSVKNGKSIFI